MRHEDTFAPAGAGAGGFSTRKLAGRRAGIRRGKVGRRLGRGKPRRRGKGRERRGAKLQIRRAILYGSGGPPTGGCPGTEPRHFLRDFSRPSSHPRVVHDDERGTNPRSKWSRRLLASGSRPTMTGAFNHSWTATERHADAPGARGSFGAGRTEWDHGPGRVEGWGVCVIGLPPSSAAPFLPPSLSLVTARLLRWGRENGARQIDLSRPPCRGLAAGGPRRPTRASSRRARTPQSARGVTRFKI